MTRPDPRMDPTRGQLWTAITINSHRQRRRDKTVEIRRVGRCESSRRQLATVCGNLEQCVNNLPSTEL